MTATTATKTLDAVTEYLALNAPTLTAKPGDEVGIDCVIYDGERKIGALWTLEDSEGWYFHGLFFPSSQGAPSSLRLATVRSLDKAISSLIDMDLTDWCRDLPAFQMVRLTVEGVAEVHGGVLGMTFPVVKFEHARVGKIAVVEDHRRHYSDGSPKVMRLQPHYYAVVRR